MREWSMRNQALLRLNRTRLRQESAAAAPSKRNSEGPTLTQSPERGRPGRLLERKRAGATAAGIA